MREEVWIVVYDDRQELVEVSLVVGEILLQSVDNGHHLHSVELGHILQLGPVTWKDLLQVLHVHSVLSHCLHCLVSLPLQLLQLCNLMGSIQMYTTDVYSGTSDKQQIPLVNNNMFTP